MSDPITVITIDKSLLTVQSDDLRGKYWVEFGRYIGMAWNNPERAEEERQQILAAIRASVSVSGKDGAE